MNFFINVQRALYFSCTMKDNFTKIFSFFKKKKKIGVFPNLKMVKKFEKLYFLYFFLNFSSNHEFNNGNIVC